MTSNSMLKAVGLVAAVLVGCALLRDVKPEDARAVAKDARSVAKAAAKGATVALIDAQQACIAYELAGGPKDPDLDSMCAALRGECREPAPPPKDGG